MKVKIKNTNFDFSGRDDTINLINDQWDNLQKQLNDNDNNLSDLDSFADNDYFKWFYQVFNNENCNRITKLLSEFPLLLRVVNEPDYSKINIDRFIPCKKYAKVNRMNYKEFIYQYFITNDDYVTEQDMIKTGVLEIRAKGSTDIYGTHFNIPVKYNSLKIINIAPKYTTKHIENNFNKMVGSDKLSAILQLILSIFLNCDMFAPIDKLLTDEQQLRLYRPFHFISEYFKKMGYAGIEYKSTVNKCTNNLVLFNKKYAVCDFTTLIKINGDNFSHNAVI